MRTTTSSRADDDSDCGSVTLELAILAPALIIALLFVIAAGHIAQARQAIEAAARDAARQASIARDPATARAAATSSAQAALSREGMSCPAHVSVDTSGFTRPVGRPATVTAHVRCTVHLADVAAGGITNTTITASFTSPIDPYRGRSLGLADLDAPPATGISAASS